jgi:hypothetical protein
MEVYMDRVTVREKGTGETLMVIDGSEVTETEKLKELREQKKKLKKLEESETVNE